MKKLFIVTLMMVLVTTLIFGGCAKEAPAPAPAPPAEKEWVPPVAGMKPGEEDLYFEWAYAEGSARTTPPPGFELTGMENFFAELEKRTEGRFKVRFAYGGIAGSFMEMPFLVGTGVNEMGGCSPIVAPAEFAFLSLHGQFGWCTGDPETDQQLADYCFYHPLGQAILDKMNLVCGHTVLILKFQPALSKRTKKIEKAEDFAGLQLGTGKPAEFIWAKELGMVPVTLHIGEFYEAMQKGMIDLTVLNPSAVVSFGMVEVVGSLIDMNLGGAATYTGVNKDKWNSLPQYIKDLWRELTPTYHNEYHIKLSLAQQQQGLEVCQQSGIEVYKLAPEEEAKVLAATAPIFEAWVAEQEGYPGGKQVREFLKDQIAYRDKITGEPFTLYTP